MKIKSKSILGIMLALNLILPIGYINNINSYATLISKNNAIDTWETKSNMPTSRRGLASVAVNNKIYCIGGSGSTSYLNTVEVYDPITDTWETKAPMPTNRGYLTGEVLYDKIYCIGGKKGSSYLNALEVYDPATNTWETKTNMPTSRFSLTSAVVNGKIYCIGGYNNSSYLNTVEVYDPVTNSWETKTSMPTSRRGLVSVAVNGKIYCIGGYNDSHLNTVEVYDPATDTWETKTNMPTNRDYLTSAVVNGKIYCIGGCNGSSYLNTVEAYVPDINKPEYRAEQAVITAENSRETTDIENARDLVNQLPEGNLKQELQNRINAINPELELERKTVSGNVDVYIKCENMLLMSLDTNSVTFEDFSGVEDMEKTNAVNISINSSLPYQLNAYLPIEIQNADKSNTMDKRILNIKENSETIYQAFTNTTDKLVLKDNCSAGNDLIHGVDIKLKGGIAHEKDVYKTTIKLEAEQK